MPRPRDSRYFVLNELKELSEEADRFADQIPQISDLEEFFSLTRETALKIKSCKSVKGISLPPDISSFLNKGNQEIKNKFVEFEETLKENIHAEKKATAGSKSTENHIKNSLLEANIHSSQKKETENMPPSSDSFVKQNQTSSLLPYLTTPNQTIKNFSAKVVLENISVSQKLLKTPIRNGTFSKLINDSVFLDSSSYVKDKNSEVVSSGLKETFSSIQKLPKTEAEYSHPQTQSYSEKKKFKIQADSEGVQTRSGAKKRLPKDNTESGSMQTRSGSRKKSPKDEIDDPNLKTRSGRKRKSSPSKDESSKKMKKELTTNIVSKSTAKISQSKLVTKNNALKPVNSLPYNNKLKVSAVIVPIIKHNTPSAVLKEKQLLEELQKKERKASEIQKRILAEKQHKAEEQKKKREEKMEKILQKRLLMEKEKEEKKEKLEKKEIEKKIQQAQLSKETAKTSILKKTKEQNEDQVKENNPQALESSEQTELNATVVKTPGKKSSSSSDSETYDLTPAPDSSTYDYSDDDDKPSGKPIPLWAQGVHLKSALIHQFYNPPNPDEIFGSYIESPDLASLFQIKKKRYLKRTSSAVWNSPPGLSLEVAED